MKFAGNNCRTGITLNGKVCAAVAVKSSESTCVSTVLSVDPTERGGGYKSVRELA